MRWRVQKFDQLTILSFELEGPVEKDVLKVLTPPKVRMDRGVVLSGRGPIWLYCWLAHYYHPAKWLAVYDPRLGGAVVVQSHTKEVEVGDLVIFHATEEEVE